MSKISPGEVLPGPGGGHLSSMAQRYAVTLMNGTVLPVPAKRYMKVREEIAALLGAEKK